jgi:hypothetical protein
VPLTFPPTGRPRSDTALAVNRRRDEYGIRPTRRCVVKPEGIFKHWWRDEEIVAARDLTVMP